MKKLIILSMLFILLVGFVSSLDFDNVKSFDKYSGKYGKVEIKNSFGLGKTISELALKENTDTCGENCYAKTTIKISEDSPLIDDVLFLELQNGEWNEKEIRSYNFYILEGKNKINYSLGEIKEKGTYEVLLEGRKNPFKTIDWIITSQGKLIDDWAVWHGSIDKSYDDFEDSSLNQSLWMNGTFGSGTKLIQETGGYAYITSQMNGGNGATVYINSTNFSIPYALNNTFKNMTLRVKLHTANSGGSLVSLGAQLNVFGNVIKSISYTGSSGDTKDDESLWFIKSNGDESFTYYDDGVSQGTFTIKDNIVQIKVYTADASSSELAEAYIYYLNFSQESSVRLNPSSIATNKTGVQFNCSMITDKNSYVKNISLWTNKSGTFQQSNYTSGLNGTINNTILSLNFANEGEFNWNCRGCDNEGNCVFAYENGTLKVDFTKPVITINSPSTIFNYGTVNYPITLNWTIFDLNFNSAWYNYNGTNVTLYGASNTTTFNITNYGNRTLILYANDSSGNLNSTTISWGYKVFENSVNYSSLIYEGQNNPIIYNLFLNGTVNSILINSLNTNYSVSTVLVDGNYIVSSNEYLQSTNLSTNEFYLIITFDDGIVTTRKINQSFLSIQISSCNSTMNNSFISFNLNDEKNISKILSGNGEYVISLSTPYTDDIYVLNGTFFGSSVNLCSSINLSATNFTYYSGGKIKYTATGFSNENYNFVKQPIPKNITLYLLNVSYAIPFKITYYGETNLPTSNQILELWKEYQAMNDYFLVEAPITSTTGEVLFNIDSENSKYRVKVYDLDYNLKRTFENQIFYCDTALVSLCTADLSGLIDSGSLSDPDKIFDFSIAATNNSLNITYEYIDGISKQTNTIVIKKVNEIETVIYNYSIYSSNGKFDIPISASKLNEKYSLQILSDGNLKFSGDFIPVPKTNKNGYLLSVILLLTFVGMAVTNGVAVVLMALIGFLVSGLFLLINGIELGWNTLGYISPLILVVALLIWKISRTER